jgi:TetR/AcrR family transcriptional repressor of nem operon
VAAAAQAFKRRGFGGVGMAELMAGMGLSHGAAYRHFRSKEALAADCLAAAMAASVTRSRGATSVDSWLAHYLAPSRVADPAVGCAFAALAVDVARAADPAMSARFAAGLEDFAATLQGAIPDLDRPGVLRLIAQAAGALILLRAADGAAIADEMRAAYVTQVK